MSYNLLLVSDDARLIQRLQNALEGTCVLMAADPRAQDSQALAKKFDPNGLIIDIGTHSGTRTVLESISALHGQYSSLPLIAIGDEMSAQLILASFRAGAVDFLDRESSDNELRTAILAQLQNAPSRTGPHVSATLIDILSPAPNDEDFDFALNAGALLSAVNKERRVLLLDFSLPVSPARIALSLETKFTIPAAIRNITRLDRTFLDSALSHSAKTGLYVLPLADDASSTDTPPALRDVLVLLQMLRALFDTIIIYWGIFSRQAALSGLMGKDRHAFLCCNQRFTSIRNAKDLLAEMNGGSLPHIDPAIVIHQHTPTIMPTPSDIVRALGNMHSLILQATPAALIHAQNSGQPLSLAGSSHYGDALRDHLATMGLLPHSHAGKNHTLFSRLRRAMG